VNTDPGLSNPGPQHYSRKQTVILRWEQGVPLCVLQFPVDFYNKLCDISLLHWPLFMAVYRCGRGETQCGKKNLLLATIPLYNPLKSPVDLDSGRIKSITYTATKIPLMCSFSGNSAASAPIFHIHVSVSDLYSPRIGLHTSSSRIGRPMVGLYKSLTDT
jgi:hypothetical protein